MRTKYKNIKVTIFISLIFGFIGFIILALVFNVIYYVSFLSGLSLALVIFYFVGRRIIIRHTVGKNNRITIEFKLRPNYKILLSNNEVEDIIYKTVNMGKYGIYTKGIILFKNHKNYHKDYFTYSFDNEIKWFWA